MKASLIESPDEHHWVLLDHRVTQLVVDESAIRLQTWSLDASIEVRLGAPFVLRRGSGERVLDPEATESLAPALTLMRRRVQSLTATLTGELTIDFSDDVSVLARPHPRYTAWEVQGGGVLEGMSYVCGPGGPIGEWGIGSRMG